MNTERYNTGTQNDELFERSNSKAFVLLVHALRVRGHPVKLGWQSEKGNLRKDIFLKLVRLSSAV